MNLQLEKHLKSQDSTRLMFQPKMLLQRLQQNFDVFHKFFEWKTFFPKVDMDTKDNPSIKSAFAWIHFWKKKKMIHWKVTGLRLCQKPNFGFFSEIFE